jgi:hypothetical protein
MEADWRLALVLRGGHAEDIGQQLPSLRALWWHPVQSVRTDLRRPAVAIRR